MTCKYVQEGVDEKTCIERGLLRPGQPSANMQACIRCRKEWEKEGRHLEKPEEKKPKKGTRIVDI